MEQQNERPYSGREPDRINEMGTKFWDIHDFDDLINELPLEDVHVMYSEYVDEQGEILFGFLIVEGDNVMFEASYKEDILEILETVKTESLKRGYIRLEEE